MQKTTRLVVLAYLAAIFLMVPALLVPVSARAQGAPRVAPQSDDWGDKTPPVGAVKSKEPKKEGKGTYNWVQMGYASLVMLGMAGFVVYLVRKNKLEPGDAPSSVVVPSPKASSETKPGA